MFSSVNRMFYHKINKHTTHMYHNDSEYMFSSVNRMFYHKINKHTTHMYHNEYTSNNYN